MNYTLHAKRGTTFWSRKNRKCRFYLGRAKAFRLHQKLIHLDVKLKKKWTIENNESESQEYLAIMILLSKVKVEISKKDFHQYKIRTLAVYDKPVLE